MFLEQNTSRDFWQQSAHKQKSDCLFFGRPQNKQLQHSHGLSIYMFHSKAQQSVKAILRFVPDDKEESEKKN